MSRTNEDHTHVQEFFGARAADWDRKFPEDGPAFTAAVGELGLGPGDRVLDAGCGTGRALTPLRAAVGPSGTVLGVDLTERMLAAARRPGGTPTAPCCSPTWPGCRCATDPSTRCSRPG